MATGGKTTSARDSAISFSMPNSVGHTTFMPITLPLLSRSKVERISSSLNMTVRATGLWLKSHISCRCFRINLHHRRYVRCNFFESQAHFVNSLRKVPRTPDASAMNKTDHVHHLFGHHDLIYDKIIAISEPTKPLPAIEHPSTVRELSERKRSRD